VTVECQYATHNNEQQIEDSRRRVADNELDLERVELLELCLGRRPLSNLVKYCHHHHYHHYIADNSLITTHTDRLSSCLWNVG